MRIFRKVVIALNSIRVFFPIELLFGMVKYNLISLFYWGLLFSIVSDGFGSSFGVPYLFFSPEYLGEISPVSFVLLGFGIGGFVVGFHTYSYMKLGFRYPFLALAHRPFVRFSTNNSLIPVIFIIYYCIKMSQFQLEEEFATGTEILIYNLSFLLGIILFITLSLLYFFPLSKNQWYENRDEIAPKITIDSYTHPTEKWYNFFRTNGHSYYFYVAKNLLIKRSRDIRHIDKDILEGVFAKNRISASIFEFLTIFSFIGLGFLGQISIFEVPAAMSIVMLITTIHMIYSTLASWLHRWTIPFIILMLTFFNFMSTYTPYFKYGSYLLGLNYNTKQKKEYSFETIKANCLDKTKSSSYENMIEILTAWKLKQQTDKPKLIIVNTSGGGSRSAYWTYLIMEKLDKELSNHFTSQTHLITGASGGMIGAAFYREIYLRKSNGNLSRDKSYHDLIAQDMLNKLSFNISTSDLLMRYQTTTINNQQYTRERGVAFEEQLHENTQNFMNHSLGYYTSVEKNAEVPVMIFSPTIVNDGRRLLISSQSLNFMTHSSQKLTTYENIDFQSFFKNNNPNLIQFSSVLRANSTFPFIMPMVSLPTSPETHIMDAGLRDNYGGKVTVEYLFALKKWIEENTSGVIIVEMRDTKRILDKQNVNQITLLDKLKVPFSTMMDNFDRTQDYDQEQLMELSKTSFSFPVDIVTFNLRESVEDRISLSWHLTGKEKQKIQAALHSEENKKALRNLKKYLGNNNDIR
ncbi:MAG: hypothetical protein ACKO7D_11640 [Bacteroidota bacterium]